LESRICYQCRKDKRMSEYHKDVNSPDGYKIRCKKCRSKHRKKYFKPKFKPQRGLVYCVECQGYYKFGVTSDAIKKRLMTMQTGNPFDIKLLWVARSNQIRKYERQIHKIIRGSHHRGEWYDIPQILAKQLRNIVTHDEES
jgi:hypothetical protein